MQATVTVTDLEKDTEYDRFLFSLRIEMSGPGWVHSFFISEPYLSKYAEWMKMLESPGSMGLYSGSGGCYSCIDNFGDEIMFTSELSGSGNDTEQRVTCAAEPLITELKKVLTDLHSRGQMN